MKEQLTELLNTLYEAEGLVEMALRRKVQTPDRITRLALDKCYQVARLAGEIKLPQTEDAADDESELPIYDAASSAEIAGEEEVMEEKEVAVFTDEILPQMSIATHKTDILDGSIFDSDDEHDLTDESVTSCPEEDDVEPEPENDYEFAEEEEVDEYAPDPVAVTPESEVNAAPCRKPIIGFLSINDKFRFRRSLMAGNDAAFRDLLGVLEAMPDLEHARAYIFSELDWDPESPDVKSFINILDRYYK